MDNYRCGGNSMKKKMTVNNGKFFLIGLSALALNASLEVVQAQESGNDSELLLQTEEQITLSLEGKVSDVDNETALEINQSNHLDDIFDEDVDEVELTNDLIEFNEIEESSSHSLDIATNTLNTIRNEEVHTVQSGEYLYLIGQRYGITVQQLKDWNNLSSNYIYSGDQLLISKPLNQETPSEEDSVGVPKPNPKPNTDNNAYYTVRPGDYLWKIANQYGITVQELKDWNKLSSNFIYSGDKLIVSATDKVTEDPKPRPEIPVKSEEDNQHNNQDNNESENSVQKTKYYTVVSGDYLWKIANNNGISVQQLKTWNNLSSNLIFSGDKLAISDPNLVNEQPIPLPEEDREEVDDKEVEEETPAKDDNPDEEVKLAEATYHTVKSGEYLWLIATRNGISVDQLKSWNNLTSNYIYSGDRLLVTNPSLTSPSENLPSGQLTGVNQAVQAVLNQYSNSSVHIFYESLLADDLRIASLNGDSAMYGASVPKVVLIAYTLEQIEKGNLSWETPLKYTSSIYNHPESYAWGGSGTIQYESYLTKTYTLQDVVYRTIAHSDNLGSNMLLHFVGYRDKADFNRFTQEIYGAPAYNRNMTPRQINKVMRYIYDHPQQFAMEALDKTNYDGSKLDTVAANVYQKIGAWWPYYNHSTAIVDSNRPYILTILTDYWSDSAIATIAKKIFNAVMS